VKKFFFLFFSISVLLVAAHAKQIRAISDFNKVVVTAKFGNIVGECNIKTVE